MSALNGTDKFNFFERLSDEVREMHQSGRPRSAEFQKSMNIVFNPSSKKPC